MIRWTVEAAKDLTSQIAWLQERNPAVADAVVRDILTSVGVLDRFPNRGRAGRRHGTRELVTGRYVVVYTAAASSVVILRLLHGAQVWPPVTE